MTCLSMKFPRVKTFTTSYNPETEAIEYFTSNEEFKASQKVDLKQLIATGPSTPTEQVFQPRYHEHIIGDPANNDAEAILFDDTDYKDSRLLIICTYSSNPLYTPFKQIENMGLFDMNDKTSSLRVHTVHNHGVNKDAILFCFENSNFNESNTSKAVLYCKAPNNGTEYTIPSLKKIPAHGGDSWNDRISSIKLIIADADDYPDGTV